MEVLESAAEAFKLMASSFGSASRDLDKLIGRNYDVEKKEDELVKSQAECLNSPDGVDATCENI